MSYFIYTSYQTKREIPFLENTNVKLRFSQDFNLELMENIITGHTHQFQNSPIWSITALDPKTKKFLTLKSTDSAIISKSKKEFYKVKINREENLSLVWNIPDYNVAVTVIIKLPQDSGLSYWDIKVENNNPNYAIWTVDFPYFDIPAFNGDKKNNYLAIPLHSGTLIKNPVDNIHWSVSILEEVTPLNNKVNFDIPSYPGTYSSQFAALYNSNGNGLYLAAYDGKMFSKKFLFNGDNENKLNYALRQYPEGMTTVKKSYISPYSAVVGVFQGDWIDAAEIYRNWAKNQIWSQKGPMSGWKDLSKKDIGIGIVALYRASLTTPILYEINKNNILAMKEFFDSRATINGKSPSYYVHFVGWSKYLDVAGETNGGGGIDYLPPQADFTSFVDELKNKGFYTGVYAGDGLFNRNDPRDKYTNVKWTDAQSYAAYNPLGEYYKYSNALQHLSWMDPSTEWWQNALSSLASNIKSQTHVDGIYWDHYPKFKLCFEESHNHSLGGGNYWALGYREMAKKYGIAGKAKDADHLMAEEGKNEIEIGLFDSFLNEWFAVEKGDMKNFAIDRGQPLPIITYLYHDYIGMAGGVRIKEKSPAGFSSPKQFSFQAGFSWVNGNGPSVPFNSGISNIFTEWKQGKLSSEWVKELDYLGKLVKMYRIGKDALFFGRYLRPPVLYGIEEESMKFNNIQTNLPVVLIGAFKSPDGTIYIPITNWSNSAQTISKIDFKKVDWLPKKYTISIVTDHNQQILGNYQEKIEINTNININPKDAFFLLIQG